MSIPHQPGNATALFVTNYKVSPPHPRVAAALQGLTRQGYTTQVITTATWQNRLHYLLRLLTFGFLEPLAVYLVWHAIRANDIVYILGARPLLVAVVAKLWRKTVIYETLDHEPSIQFYNLRYSKYLRAFHKLKIIEQIFAITERMLVHIFCDRVLVNSIALYEYFNRHATVLFYFSPFEGLAFQNQAARQRAILYLGIFSTEKGAEDVLNLCERLKLPLFIFGEIPNPAIHERVINNQQIIWQPRLSSAELFTALQKLANDYFLIGTSLIYASHYSYATQEANKDIDYLCLGIPFIGNHRRTTEEKILAGAGVFADDESAITRLLYEQKFAEACSTNCQLLYKKIYARHHYFAQFAAAFAAISPSLERQITNE